jgi:WD40 repeat protein
MLHLSRLWPGITAVLLLAAVPVRAQQPDSPEAMALCFLPDGKTLVAACLDDKLHIYDVPSGTERSAVSAHKDGVWSAALSPDGKHLITGGGDGLVKLWDAKTLKNVRVFEGCVQEALAVAMSPDGKMLAAGGADGVIYTWDLATGKKPRFWRGHECKVLSLSFSPNGKALASGGTCFVAAANVFRNVTHADHVRLWDPQTGKEIRELAANGQEVAYAPDGRSLAMAGYYLVAQQRANGVAKAMLRAETQASIVAPVKELDAHQMSGAGTTLALSADGRLLALANGSRRQVGGTGKFGVETWGSNITLWETATGKQILEIPQADVSVLAISPDGKKLAAGIPFLGVRFYDLAPEGWPKDGTAPKLDPERMEKLWVDLAAEEALPAYRAIWALGASGTPAAAFLKEKLRPLPPPSVKVAGLLAKLDSDKYSARETAYRDLKKLGAAIEGDLREAAEKEKASVEFCQRVEKLLENMHKRPASTEELQQLRALQVLERMASAAARGLMAQVAAGAPGAWLTLQAQLALKRLESRN